MLLFKGDANGDGNGPNGGNCSEVGDNTILHHLISDVRLNLHYYVMFWLTPPLAIATLIVLCFTSLGASWKW